MHHAPKPGTVYASTVATPSGTTRLRLYNVLEGHGIGKLIAGLALSAARKDADAFAARIKAAVEGA
jgi:hypothetical protein